MELVSITENVPAVLKRVRREVFGDSRGGDHGNNKQTSEGRHETNEFTHTLIFHFFPLLLSVERAGEGLWLRDQREVEGFAWVAAMVPRTKGR